MKNVMNEKIMKILIGISALMIMIGAYLKICHYEIGQHLLTYGFIASIILYAFENNQLKKIIKKLENEKHNDA